MKKINPRRPYRDDAPGGDYYESDRDYVLNNLEACVTFLNSHVVDPCETPPSPTCRQTACKHCGLDVEGFAPFNNDTMWLDRGGNAHCNDGVRKHEGVL
jgi:hypothetical protein